MKPIREQLKELVVRHGLRVDEVFETYAARMEQGMTPQAAFESIRDELAKLPGQVGATARDDFELIVKTILASGKITRDELMKRVHEKQAELHGFVTVEGAASMVAKELGVAVGDSLSRAMRAVVPRPQVPGQQKEILLPVEETKFEEFAIGVHPVKISDVRVDEGETGNVDREGKPEMRRYVRIIFEDAKGVHMTGFASAKVSTRSKLFDWIKKITGQVPEIGKVYNVSSLVGRKCRVYVQETVDETGQRRRKIGDVLPVESGT